MEKKKKLNKLKVGIVVFLIMFAFAIAVFGRYVYNSVREAYLTAKQFYFTSNILTVNGAHYTYSNWNGIETYPIEFDLYTFMNQVTKLDYDLDYSVTCTTSDTSKITCTLNDSGTTTITGTIPATTNSSKVIVHVTPKNPLAEGDSVKVKVTASTTVPYQKTISCEFTLRRETPEGVSYTIEDVEQRDYALLKITNENASEKAITLSFDPTKIRIDSNDEIYVNRESSGMTTTTINGNSYVNKFVFKLDAETTRYVKFYKVEKAQNYTYPVVNPTSAIQVTTT